MVEELKTARALTKFVVPPVWDVKLAYARQVVDMPTPEDDFEAAAARARRESLTAEIEPMLEIAPEGCTCDLCRHHMRIYDLIASNELRQAGKKRRR